MDVLVVGCGCFGVSSALHLLEKGYRVTIIDKAGSVPAPDAASSDLNKIVRSTYSDPYYSSLAKEAIAIWKQPAWGDVYHETGVVIVDDKNSPESTSYINKGYRNDLNIGSRVQLFDRPQLVFPTEVEIGPHASRGYVNWDGGWAFSSKGVELAIARIIELGGQIKTGKTVTTVRFDGAGRATGVLLSSGESLEANIVIIATGSWTESTFDHIGLGAEDQLLATGQSIATIQLSPQEARAYGKCPVVLNFDSGFYVFPPNESGVMKFAIHHAGYINPQPAAGEAARSVSTPHTVTIHGDEGYAIPRRMVDALLAGLSGVYPALSTHRLVGTRMCWYCDRPSADWLIDFHPEHPGLLFATGGSGHAYKFLPVIGKIVLDRLEGRLDRNTASRFAFEHPNVEDPSRAGQIPKRLHETEFMNG